MLEIDAADLPHAARKQGVTHGRCKNDDEENKILRELEAVFHHS